MTTNSYRTDDGGRVAGVVTLQGNADGSTTAVASAPVGSAGTSTATAQTVQGTLNGVPLPSALKATTTGGLSVLAVVSLATVNATLVKASAGQLYFLSFGNNNATTWRYLKVFNKATAPVPGTDTPIAVFPIAPNSTIELFLTVGLSCSLGVGLAVTANGALNDATAVAAGEVIGTLGYA